MTSRTIYHVLPHGDLWAVKINQGKRASSLHARKTQAMRAASALAKGHPSSQVVIHAATGKIRGDRTFGYRDYAKKRKVRKVVGKIKKTKANNHQRALKERRLRSKAAKLGLDRKRRARLVRSRVAKVAARKHSR